MNLNAYDELNVIDKTKPWYSASLKRIYIKLTLKSKLYYKFTKRVNVKTNNIEYYLVLTNDFRNTKRMNIDSYGRIKINVPTEIINNTSLRDVTEDINIDTHLVDMQWDSEIYLLCI